MPMSSTEPSQNNQAPLQGLRVLDLSSMIAGPHAAQILADDGADVIKIEPPEGDLMRRGIGAARKRRQSALPAASIATSVASLLTSSSRRRARRCCNCARRPMSSSTISVRRRCAASRSVTRYVRKINPRLVYVGVMGYGESGPYAGKPAYDDLIQGFCALPALVARAAECEPRYVPMTVVDRIVGINAAHAILAAVLRRDRNGEGQCVELPMFETMAQFVLGDHLGGRRSSRRPATPATPGWRAGAAGPTPRVTAMCARWSTPTSSGKRSSRAAAVSICTPLIRI